MTILEQKVGDIVAKDFRAAHIFTKNNIDFCCGGHRTLKSAIAKVNADENQILSALEKLHNDGFKENALARMTPTDLINYIVEKHHSYTREKLELLMEYSQKMIKAHGANYPEVKDIANEIAEINNDLLPHLEKEEQVLFLGIQALENGIKPSDCCTDINKPINAMEMEHNTVGDILRKLNELTNNYQAPSYACTTWKVCYSTLAEFEADLHKHVHIENNILFPKAISLQAN